MYKRQREDPTDLFLSVDYDSLENLPAGAVVGTSSLRRQAQVLAQRPDLEVVSLRGNVDTRLRKLTEGQFAAIIMATAGMKRLGLSVPKECPLAPPAFIPAVGQGALGIEFREDRKDLAEIDVYKRQVARSMIWKRPCAAFPTRMRPFRPCLTVFRCICCSAAVTRMRCV